MRTKIALALSALAVISMGPMGAAGLRAPVGSLAAPDVLNFAEAPAQIAPVAGHAATPPGGEDFTSVEFNVQNRSKSPLTRIALQVNILTSSGAPKGYFSFEMPLAVRPGSSSYAVYGAAETQAIGPTDRVVLLPLAADGPSLHWQARDERVQAVTRALVAARGETSLVAGELTSASEALTPQNPTPPPDPNGGGCTACDNAPQKCKDFCSPCLAASYACNCTPFSTSCTCNTHCPS